VFDITLLSTRIDCRKGALNLKVKKGPNFIPAPFFNNVSF